MSTREHRVIRRLLFPLLAAALGVLVLVATAEVAVRVIQPTPRIQVVRLDQPDSAWVEREGVPFRWDPGYSEGPIRGGDCPPGAPVVGVAGDSVLFTTDDAGDGHRVGDELRDALEACVQDGAWPGYLPYQELAMLRWIDARTPLSVGILLVWKEDRRYWRLGHSLYDSELVVHDAVDGLPQAPLQVPKALHRWLFTHARIWEYATIALAPRLPDGPDPAGAYLEAIAWAADRGLPLVLVEAVALDTSFAEASARRAAAPPELWMKRLQVAAEARGFDYVVLADALIDEDVEAIRLDQCCHYDREGHAAIARALLPYVRAALDRPATTEKQSSDAAVISGL